MSKKKSTLGSRAKKDSSLVRSSAAEYLTFVAASGAGGVEAVYADENVWLTQKMMGLLYDVDVRTISYHLKNVFADHELEENSVIQFFRITAADGELQENSVIRNFRITAPEARARSMISQSNRSRILTPVVAGWTDSVIIHGKAKAC